MSKVRVWSSVPLPDIGRGQIVEVERTPRIDGLIRNGRLVELAPKPDRWEDHRVDELRDALRDRGLPVSGNKDELVDRLVEAEQPPAADDEESDEVDDGG